MADNDDPTGNPSSILLGGEDIMEVDEAMPMAPSVEETVETSDELISKIISPSPYPHHITGPTSSRFRNALSRINTDPFDVEAWQALMTEANACWRGIQAVLHNNDSDTHSKLDWMESCYGNLLKYFPYATSYWETIIDMLIAQSARVGEEGGPYMDYGPSKRGRLMEAKVERIFRDILGIEIDGNPVDGNILGGMCTSSVEIWLLYIRKRVRDGNRLAIPQQDEKVKAVREITVKAYESAIQHTSFVHNNHIIWKHYLGYVKSWIPNPALNQDHALAQKQMVQLRSIYQRLVTHPMLGLDQLWQEYEGFERGQSEALAVALIAEYAPKYQHARNVYLDRNRVFTPTELQLDRLAAPPADADDEDYASKMSEESRLLTVWKKRCAFERTNPERLSHEELSHRVRQAYKDFVGVFSRHPEVWHMWSVWELLQGGSKASEKTDCSRTVLKMGREYVPGCTLLAYAEAQLVELHTDQPQDCLQVMESFLERSPNTLGFVLYQQMIRRYKGADEARAVFAKARRVLRETGSNEDVKKAEDVVESTEKEDDEQQRSAAALNAENGKRRMVTNRLDAAVGTSTRDEERKEAQENGQAIEVGQDSQEMVVPGQITWQLYASHAVMEHRLNRAPKIAARVYELGLRKHVSFLTKAPYIMRYAQLLLELQDTDNLRALLTRAIAACEADSSSKADEVATLWDLRLRFESILSCGDPSSVKSLRTVELRRHAALMGADTEDVSTGGLLAGTEPIQISGQKTTLSEQLLRTEGYDTSSSVVNGLSRTVDVLQVMGLWGRDEMVTNRRRKNASGSDSEDWSAGGKSDASYQRRLNYQKMLEAGESTETALGLDTGSKLLSARERLQAGTGSQGAQSSAVAVAIQQAPEWLRPLLLLLPASRLRMAILAPPPPHMVELALTSLRSSTLPTERPVDNGDGVIPRKRKLEGGDDSDDDDDDAVGGGYGSQFRARQRARQMGLAGQQNGGVS
jgi:hypothetical protein